MHIAYLAILLSATACSAAFALFIRHAAPKFGLIDQPAGRKAHKKPTPLGGGVAIFAGTCLPVAAGLAACFLATKGSILPFSNEALRLHAGGVMANAGRLAWIGGCGLFLAIVGLVDDRLDIGPMKKLAAQILAGLVLFLGCGVSVSVFMDSHIIRLFLTILWIAFMTNSFNLLDNMDGLTGGIACITSAMIFVVAYQTGQVFICALLCAFIGALAGFLLFNFPPASIFMGDCGSLFVGYFLAVVTALTTFLAIPSGSFSSGIPLEESAVASPIFPIAVPLCIFAIPLYDTVSVILIRLHQKRPVFKGDRSHFSHRLLALGMTPRQVLLTIYLATFCTGAGATIFYQSSRWSLLVVPAQVMAVLGVIVLLELAARLRNDQDNDPPSEQART
ncbi:MAG TPA: MraY family glycosyltransferase [Candidatus Brocadiia bacterium]|nr:MraY family glycosyltransferase [Candidatus Brocadiia bacterium]